MEHLAVLILAIAWDLTLGEPPSIVHPVVWIGKAISLLEAWAPEEKFEALVHGAAMTLLVTVAFGGGAFVLLSFLHGVSLVAYVLVGAYLLKSSFSLRELYRAGVKMRKSLSQESLALAREEVRALVSRDTESLDEPHLVSATVESLSENITDSLVAPMLFFLVLGVPGALAYRAVNTMDAMIGYRGRYEYLGKVAARLDDLLNYIPARLAALAVVAGAFGARQDGWAAWHIMRRDANRTESPNAGWTMAAAAGALGIKLEKIGHYRLGNDISTLSRDKIGAMLTVLGWTAAVWLAACIIAEVVLATA